MNWCVFSFHSAGGNRFNFEIFVHQLKMKIVYDKKKTIFEGKRKDENKIHETVGWLCFQWCCYLGKMHLWLCLFNEILMQCIKYLIIPQFQVWTFLERVDYTIPVF